MRDALPLVLVLIFGCQSHNPSSPEGSFARLAPCINKADAKCLFNRLDRDSRWSLQTIHKLLAQARVLVARSYPEGAKETAFGVWKQEAVAATPEALLEAYCQKNNCLKRIARSFGAVTNRRKTGPDTVVLETTRGGKFEMFFGENRWGITLFREELKNAKLRIQDRLNQVEINAAQFDQQRSAGTLGATKQQNSKEM